MKVLLDSCVWGRAKSVLETAGFDTLWVGDFPNDPGDEEVIDLAYRENRVLVTLDKDFGELAIIKGASHRGIIRMVGFRAQEQGSVCIKVLRKYQVELVQGAIITATRDRIRVRLNKL